MKLDIEMAAIEHVRFGMETTAGMTRRWHLAFTKPCAEGIAKLNLERQGYKVYLPLVKLKSLRRGKWLQRTAALFPRYLFVQLDAERQTLAPVCSTIGIAGVVRFGIDYAVVPTQIVDRLIAREDPRTRLHSLRIGAELQPGRVVRIATGVLSGLEGIFHCEDTDERVIVLLDLLGRHMPVAIGAGNVIPTAA